MQVQSQKWQNDLWSNCALWIYCFCCSVAKLCPTLCNPVDCSSPGLPVPHYLPEISQVHIHWISDAIQPSQPLSTSSLSAFKLYQHLFLFFVFSSNSFEKTLMLGKTEGGRRGRQRMMCLDGITGSMDEFEWPLGIGDGQESLACCSLGGCKELDTTEWLNWTENIILLFDD